MTDHYRRLREERPDLFRAAVEIGAYVSCAGPALPDESVADHMAAIAATVERRVMEVLSQVLDEHAEVTR